MINLLVVSDTHGNCKQLNEVLSNQFKLGEKHRPSHLLHLGDGVEDIEKCKVAENFCICAVRGNCDSIFYNEHYPQERILELGGIKILMMHGHKYAVKLGLNQAVLHAAECDADILLYGHTHVQESYTLEKGAVVEKNVLKKPLLVFNPGSLGYNRSFGIISIDSGKVLVSHGSIN